MKNKFKPAISGIVISVKDKSIRIQMIFGVLAVIAGIAIQLRLTEWIWVLFSIGLVITTEIINTAIEKMCDFMTKSYNDDIRIIKDLSAGAVLIASFTAMMIALLILFNHLERGY